MYSVPVIVVAVYWLMNIYKLTVKSKEKYKKWIPVLAGLFGMALGAAAFYLSKDIMPADSVFSAILIGGSSGLAATGTNQIFKQLTKE